MVEAARRLGIHRSRIEALIQSGSLHATKTGSQWVIDVRELDRYDNVRPHRRGRRLTAVSAWDRMGRPEALLAHAEDDSVDEVRRNLRSRAAHEPVYVHPGLLGQALDDPNVRLGGRDAAIEAGAPLDPDGIHDVYLRASAGAAWMEQLRVQPEHEQPNVWLHRVPDDACSTVGPGRHLGLFVAWLDLADRLDRGADLVLDRLTGGVPVREVDLSSDLLPRHREVFRTAL